MTNALRLLREVLTPTRRKAIYLVLGSVVALLAVFGVVAEADAMAVVDRIDAILAALALFLAAGNVDTSTPNGAPAEEYEARHASE